MARIATIALVLGAVAVALRAHEGHEHLVKGTVASIGEGKLVVETTGGARNLYLLTEETRYLRGKQETTRDDIVVGERVAVKFESRAGGERATEVRLGAKKP